jgi:predicted dehydrogenase
MDMEDLATCILKYKNGPTATISVGWVFKDFYGSIQVNGTAKSEYINLRSKNIVKRVTRDIRTKLGQHDHDSTYSELKYFVDCIINDKLLKPSGEEGLQDLQVIESAYRIESRQTQTEKTQIE